MVKLKLVYKGASEMIPMDEVLSQAKTMAATAGRRTEEFVEITKVRLKIAEKRRIIADLYEGLGRLVYDCRTSDTTAEDMIDACVDALREQQAELERLEECVMMSKNVICCNACGAINTNNAVFCNQCGKEFGR